MAEEKRASIVSLLSVNLAREPDAVTARRRAKQVASLLGFESADQSRIATSTSEIARNALQYAGGGRVNYSVDLKRSPAALIVVVSDEGRGIENLDQILNGSYLSRTGLGLGVIGTRRLMDEFSIESQAGKGTSVRFAKYLPKTVATPTSAILAAIAQQLTVGEAANAYEELQHNNQELLELLDTIRRREADLALREVELKRLNQELVETNRGVVALYAELDEKAEALRLANEIKSRFLSHMSHEFRTPLNSILALTSLLTGKMDGDLTAAQGTQVGYIRQAAQELFEMVNDLLDLAKVESGIVDLRITQVDMGQLLGTLRAMLRPLVVSEVVNLRIDEPSLPLVIQTDEGKLAQILRNLVSNALKFTESGEVRVTTSRVADHVSFSVSDTGIGIAPEDQARIFRDFAQVEHPIQRRVKGTGLGLPLSQKLAHLLGGEISVTSKTGVGSRFVLTLPIPAESHSNPVRPPSDTILLIDDEEASRYLAKQMLLGTKHDFLEAATAIEGTERARFEIPKLIFLDLGLPDRSGFDVLEDLKADEGTRHIPVLIYSSRTLNEQDLSRLGAQHAGVVPKGAGASPETLDLIRQILGEPDLFDNKSVGL